jgi:hypothetical protein
MKHHTGSHVPLSSYLKFESLNKSHEKKFGIANKRRREI